MDDRHEKWRTRSALNRRTTVRRVWGHQGGGAHVWGRQIWMVVPERPFVTETQFSVAHQESSAQAVPTGRNVGCGAHSCGGRTPFVVS